MSSPRTLKSATIEKPAYDQVQSAFHVAFAGELSAIVEQMPLASGLRVLDIPCGNGFYSQLIARRLGAAGRLDCVDPCLPYLASTRRRLQKASYQVHQSDVYRLPFADGMFDLISCAQSMISFSRRLAVLSEMVRVLRPVGTLAILENDLFHSVLLPWPADLEAPVQHAIQLNTSNKIWDRVTFDPDSPTPASPRRRRARSRDKAHFRC